MRSINLTRIKPLLDEYQACYHERYRWFAGYYLACRVFVFIFSLINLGEFGSIFFLQMICIVILVIHTVIQPYKEQWLNVLDSILLADLAIYSLFNGSTANVVLGGYSSAVRGVLVHSLILIPLLYFPSLSLYKLNNVLKISYRIQDFWSARKPASSVKAPDLFPPSDIFANQYIPQVVNMGAREPLLFIHKEKHPSDSKPRKHRHTKSSSHNLSTTAKPARASQAVPVNPKRTQELRDTSVIVDVYQKANFTRTSISPPR